MLSLKIEGEIPTKKNNYRITKTGRLRLGQDTVAWNTDALWQLKDVYLKGKLKKPMDGPLVVDVQFKITVNKDIDNMQNTLFDILQTGKIIKNDKLIQEVHAKKTMCAKDPCVMIIIYAKD